MDGLLHGTYKEYYENGDLKEEVFYNLGKKLDKS
jgi:antitoxin component YwqK of YwqJK toxin-antitoxin module